MGGSEMAAACTRVQDLIDDDVAAFCADLIKDSRGRTRTPDTRLASG